MASIQIIERDYKTIIQNNVKYTISYKPIEGYCTVIPTAYYKPLAIGIAEL